MSIGKSIGVGSLFVLMVALHLSITSTIARAGDDDILSHLDAALESYRNVAQGEARVSALAGHVGARSWVGDVDGAKRVWGLIEAEALENLAAYSDETVGHVVWALAGLNDLETAPVLAMRIRGAKLRGKALGYVAATRVLSGDLDGARRFYDSIAKGMETEEFGVAGSLMQALTLSGQAAEGLAFVRARGQETGTGALLMLVSHAAAVSGDQALVTDVLSGIGDFASRIGALMFAIDGFWQGGHRDTANDVLGDTIVKVNSSGDLHLVVDSYPMIAAMLYRWGSKSEAITVSDHLLDAFPTWKLEHGPDHVQTNHTDILGSIDAIADLRGRESPVVLDRQLIPTDVHWDSTMVGRAMIYAMAGRHDAAMSSVADISAPVARRTAAIDAVKLLLASKGRDKAAGAAAQIADPGARGRAFDLIALAARFGTVPFHLDWQ